MENNVSGDAYENIDWDTDDDLEIETYGTSPVVGTSALTKLPTPTNCAIDCNGEASSSACPSSSRPIQQFVAMGFPEDLVIRAMEENGEDSDHSTILETLLTLSALKESPEGPQCIDYDLSSSDYDESFPDDLSDTDSWSENELVENTDSLSEEEKTLRSLVDMGYTTEEASIAMERCGPEASIAVLTDCIFAAQMVRAEDPHMPAEVKPKMNHICSVNEKLKKRRMYPEVSNKKRHRGMLDETIEVIRLPKPMIGFGLPSDSGHSNSRILPERSLGPPFFYYENVALTPKGVWDTISRFLYGVEPEFVDSKYFCATARKRGYVHNLPIANRFPIIPTPPFTIHEAFPLTKRWWPSWDTRTKLNCLQTAYASARLQERIRKAIETFDGEPPEHVQKFVLDQCRKWNLVWVGRNKVAPLEPDEVEVLLGFPKNHTRGGGTSRTDRYKSLGNSFQVDTVAYHLSVLKELFPSGINVLSLFSGIGGAEVALHRLGVPLKNVVSVEKSEVNRTIVQCWWEQTNQKGNLIHFDDVQKVNKDCLESLMGKIGGFDLVIGGSPCNNLAGSNRVSRDGLEGKDSSLFYDYFRILDLVKDITNRR